MPISNTTQYVGRFAPSPSGPLHFGSLVTALASFLQAKSHHGRWLIRIDDIDPPREMPGASQLILDTVLAHGMQWDDSAYFQSQASSLYQETLDALQQRRLSYFCRCTRREIKALGRHYQGTCRDKDLTAVDCATRLRNDFGHTSVSDALLGTVTIEPEVGNEDFVLKRRDGLFAYHLASVVDDIRLGITEVVRGADLLEPTVCQLALFDALSAPYPSFIHLPVAATAPGQKLSKQNHAKPLRSERAAKNLIEALQFLNHAPPATIARQSVDDIIQWSIENWRLNRVPPQREVLINQV